MRWGSLWCPWFNSAPESICQMDQIFFSASQLIETCNKNQSCITLSYVIDLVRSTNTSWSEIGFRLDVCVELIFYFTVEIIIVMAVVFLHIWFGSMRRFIICVWRKLLNRLLSLPNSDSFRSQDLTDVLFLPLLQEVLSLNSWLSFTPQCSGLLSVIYWVWLPLITSIYCGLFVLRAGAVPSEWRCLRMRGVLALFLGTGGLATRRFEGRTVLDLISTS